MCVCACVCVFSGGVVVVVFFENLKDYFFFPLLWKVEFKNTKDSQSLLGLCVILFREEYKEREKKFYRRETTTTTKKILPI